MSYDNLHHQAGAANLAADAAYDRLLDGMDEAATYRDILRSEMQLTEPALTEVPTDDVHRLLVLDETDQPGGAFKGNGAAYAVLRAAEDPQVDTIYAASAGNWGAAVASAAARAGLRATVFLPADASPVKETVILRQGARTDTSSTDVVDALGNGRAAADADPSGVFLHAFDDPHGVAGQGLVAQRLVEGLQGHHESGQLDLQSSPVEILVQRGGGSLLAGIAAAVMRVRAAGRMGDDVQVREVRPERTADGNLNPVFDGLAVDQPGTLTAPLLADERYVAGTTHITEREAGRAALRMLGVNGKRYEPSGLTGLAAYEQRAPQTEKTTTFVTVLSGANVTEERFDYLVAQAAEATWNSSR